jgi:cytochrome P450
MQGRLPQLMLENSREVGPIFRLALPTWGPVSCVCDLSLARQLLEADSNKSHGYRKFKQLTFNQPNIVSKDTFHDGWDWARKGVSPSFSNTNLYKTLPKLHMRLNEFLELLDEFTENRKEFNINQMLLQFTFNFIATSMFGVDFKVDNTEQSQSEGAVFLRSLDICVHDVFSSKTLRVDRLWNGEPERAEAANKKMREFAQGILDNYRSTHTAQEMEADTSILAHLLRSPYETDEARCADMVVFLIAGHDTTSFTLAWTIIELCKHPEAVARLREEIDLVNKDPDQEFTVNQLSQMEYLVAVIKEAMRLWPVAATGSGRRYDRDITVGNYVIPKDSNVLFPFFAIFRSGVKVFMNCLLDFHFTWSI